MLIFLTDLAIFPRSLSNCYILRLLYATMLHKRVRGIYAALLIITSGNNYNNVKEHRSFVASLSDLTSLLNALGFSQKMSTLIGTEIACMHSLKVTAAS